MMSENLYDFSKRQDENTFDHLVRVSVDKINKLHKHDWTDIKEDFNFEHSSDNLRKYATGFKMMVDNGYVKGNVSGELPKYKEVTELKGDGSQTSDKLIRISEQEMKNPELVLIAHGYDPKDFELVNSRSSMWNSSVDNTLYSSRITVKPKVNGFDIDKIIEKINAKLHTRKVSPLTQQGQRMLEIPLFDLHFGIGDLEYYEETLAEILEVIEYRKWDTIFIPIGQDAIHTDGFNGTTTSGTIIGEIEFEKTINEVNEFYTYIIDKAIENSNNVNIMYSAGNHDQLAGYMFVRMLEKQYKDNETVKFDTEMKQRKAFKWKDVFVGVTHGDRGGNRIKENFMSDFGRLIADARVIEIHSGHIHHEVVKDSYGIVVRSLPTKAKTDKYHDVNGFVGSRKSFQLFEYTEDKMKKVHIV